MPQIKDRHFVVGVCISTVNPMPASRHHRGHIRSGPHKAIEDDAPLRDRIERPRYCVHGHREDAGMRCRA
ncbi:hypothetical protein [Thioalkalivibrio sp. HK1]|uniref:hypothetical protein n=1 Tax=Thioalkalivibrio sp. HK1 TaxID=1469245 RepID=UPI0012DE956E|nr:hypothetical protein [Thioalkalivibrio sp. HK1]